VILSSWILPSNSEMLVYFRNARMFQKCSHARMFQKCLYISEMLVCFRNARMFQKCSYISEMLVCFRNSRIFQNCSNVSEMLVCFRNASSVSVRGRPFVPDAYFLSPDAQSWGCWRLWMQCENARKTIVMHPTMEK